MLRPRRQAGARGRLRAVPRVPRDQGTHHGGRPLVHAAAPTSRSARRLSGRGGARARPKAPRAGRRDAVAAAAPLVARVVRRRRARSCSDAGRRAAGTAAAVRATRISGCRRAPNAVVSRAFAEARLRRGRRRNVLRLQKLLALPEHAGIALAGREHALYEELHRSNPERFVSKARFMVIMRRVFGFELAPVRGAVDADVKHLVEGVFDAFDERGDDKMAWRSILLMLHVVLFPTLSPTEHLRWGFALIGSEGSFDPERRPASEASLSRRYDARLG